MNELVKCIFQTMIQEDPSVLFKIIDELEEKMLEMQTEIDDLKHQLNGQPIV